eukprot:254027-Lingulodinium_polyedra.AAC.1
MLPASKQARKQASKQASCISVSRHTGGPHACTRPYTHILDAPVLQAYWQQHQGFVWQQTQPLTGLAAVSA